MPQIPAKPQPLRYYDRLVVIAKCSADHDDLPAQILEVSTGKGRHIHDSDCGYSPDNPLSCLRHCSDSDLVIELEYGSAGWHAVYGLKDGAFSLWAD